MYKMYKFQPASIRNQVFLTSIFDWRRTVQKINFLRYLQRLFNPRQAFLIMCPTMLSCINGRICHFRDFFTGLYEKKSRCFFLFSFIAFLEPFIISISLCTFCLVVASCNFYLKNIKHEVPPPSAQFLTKSVDENQLINLNLFIYLFFI